MNDDKHDEEQATRELIRDLVAGLEPVRRFPRLAVAVVMVLATWALSAVVAAWIQWPPFDRLVISTSNAAFVLVVIGLAVAALAGVVAAVAGVVPARDVLERRARWVGAGGLFLAVGVGAFGALTALGGSETPIVKDFGCFALGTGVGVLPAVVLVLLEHRGFVQRPARSAALTLLGGFGLGGLAIQLVCHYPGARHMLLGHIAVPIVMLALGVVPLAVLLGRFAAEMRQRV